MWQLSYIHIKIMVVSYVNSCHMTTIIFIIKAPELKLNSSCGLLHNDTVMIETAVYTEKLCV